jgi:dTMP kinase
MFVAFEGLDGSGGTTQIGLFAGAVRARGRGCVVTREPSDGPVGALIRAQLAVPAGGWVAGASDTGNAVRVGDAVFGHLFAADRRDHLDRIVLPAVSRGEVVLTDRYFLSSLAYQSLALGLDRVWRLNEEFVAADAVVMLDLAPEECLRRVEARGGVRDRFETLDQLRKIGDAYEAAISRCVARGDRIVRIDARGAPEEVHARVWSAVWPT